jgi:hypothetical protein
MFFGGVGVSSVALNPIGNSYGEFLGDGWYCRDNQNHE